MTAFPRQLFFSMLCASALLAACGGGESADTMLASAKGYLAQRDLQAAVIQLRNALQKSPNSAEARFLLGQARLDSGDAASAIVELRRALELRYPDVRVLPPLARALNADRQFKNLIDRYAAIDLPEPGAAADLKSSIAVAYAAQGDAPAGRVAMLAALRAVPDYPPALLLQARVEADARRFDEAAALVDKAIAGAPSNPEVWHYKGDLLLFGKSDAGGALEAYRKALSLKPDHVPAHASLISMLLGQHDLPAAAAQIEVLRKAAPKYPQTVYFDAQLAFLRQDFIKARELTQQLLKLAPDSVKVLQLAGAVQLQNGALLEAERSLGKALKLAPELTMARRLLARTYLRSGQPDKALATLQPLLDNAEPDPEAHALAAEAQLQSGHFDAAETSFARAAKLNPRDTKSRIALALVQVEKGHGDAALAQLQSIASADKGSRADLALVTLYIRRKEYERALKAIDAIEAKQPDKPLAANLRGRVHLMRNNPAEARRSFERALAINPGFVPAATALAGLDLADKHPDAARKRFESVLAVDPKNLEALMAIAGMRSRAGAPTEEVASLLVAAGKLNPAERVPRLLLVDHYLKHKDFKSALRTAQDAAVALPDSLELLDALGRAQAAAGETQQAITTFGKLAGLQPRSPQAYMRLAGVQLSMKNVPAAEQSLRRALSVQPDLLPAQQLLLELALADKRGDEALSLARAVRKQRPTEPVGMMLEAGVEVARNNLVAAAELYRATLKKHPLTDAAIRLHAVLVGLGKAADADRFAAGWMAEHPKDAAFLSYQGGVSLAKRNYDTAERQFRGVIALEPDNAAALNNVSWLMARQNKAGAVDYARKALLLQPDAPALLDTLATALAADNQVGQALEVQKKALALAPASPALRLGLAKLYIRSGDRAAARTELDTLTRLGDRFNSQPEVGQLLKTL